jgi:hypothetical protein
MWLALAIVLGFVLILSALFAEERRVEAREEAARTQVAP